MVSFTHEVGVAFALSTAAGFATVLGGCIVLSSRLVHLANPMSLAMALSVSGGVMLFISFVEIYNKSVQQFTAGIKTPSMSTKIANGHGQLCATLCFAAGILLIYAIDYIVAKVSPEAHATELEHMEFDVQSQNEHNQIDADKNGHATARSPCQDSFMEVRTPTAQATADLEANIMIRPTKEAVSSLNRMGVLMALAIGFHNIPEGVATFVGALKDPSVGASLAIGIGLHNIPEGIAVATPIFFATKSRFRAVLWCVLSALAEPFGAVLAWLVVGDGLNLIAEGVLFGVVCGIMVCISMKELLPTAFKFSQGRTDLVAIGTFIGMFIMVASLILFGYAGV